MHPLTQIHADAIIVGGGIAGLTAALELAPHRVILLLNARLGEGAATAWAQGGIAAAVGHGDSPQQHAQDTLSAAAGIADRNIVSLTAREAPQRILELIAMGAQFDRTSSGDLALGREAAHSVNRILHIHGDGTGAGLMQALIAAVRNCPSITVAENCAAEELLMSQGRVCGVIARPMEHNDAPAVCLRADAVLLASGGIGGLFSVTTNPPGCNGEGLAIAAAAGAVLADLEFVQFHPTAMDVGLSPAPLASEALRGEGAILVNEQGERFMQGLHPAAELAPRDIVARAIWKQLRDGHKTFLDCRAAIGAQFPIRFPTVFALAGCAGYNPATDLLPVAPAEHYHMGGIATDCNGRSSVPGLWACGEVAATGLHGANRLASNSLLEGSIFGARAAADIAAICATHKNQRRNLSPSSLPRFKTYDAPELASLIDHLRDIMTQHCGVIRNAAGLSAALDEIEKLSAKAATQSARISNMLKAAKLICMAALRRCESRGGHFRDDYPATDPAKAQRSFYNPAEAEVEIRKARIRA